MFFSSFFVPFPFPGDKLPSVQVPWAQQHRLVIMNSPIGSGTGFCQSPSLSPHDVIRPGPTQAASHQPMGAGEACGAGLCRAGPRTVELLSLTTIGPADAHCGSLSGRHLGA